MDQASQRDGSSAREWPWFGAAVALLYTLVAIAVHHAGPFYVFDMYAFKAVTSTSRLCLLDDDGHFVDIESVAAIRCPDDSVERLEEGACHGVIRIDALDDKVWDILQTRPLPEDAPGVRSMAMVRRAFHWSDGTVRASECARVRCDVLLPGGTR